MFYTPKAISPALVSLALLGVFVSGCATESSDDGNVDDSSTGSPTETGDGDGDPTGDGDGDGDPTGDGDGDGDPTGDGDGDGDHPDCVGGDINDQVWIDGPVLEGAQTYDCQVTSVEYQETAPPTHVIALDCDDGASSQLMSLNFSPIPALEGDVPFSVDQLVVLQTWFENFPPFGPSFVLRDAGDDRLLFMSVEESGATPYLAADGWDAPLEIDLAPSGYCTPSRSNTEARALAVTYGDLGETLVFNRHSALLEQPEADLEYRVNWASTNPDIDGGCNTCVGYVALERP